MLLSSGRVLARRGVFGARVLTPQCSACFSSMKDKIEAMKMMKEAGQHANQALRDAGANSGGGGGGGGGEGAQGWIRKFVPKPREWSNGWQSFISLCLASMSTSLAIRLNKQKMDYEQDLEVRDRLLEKMTDRAAGAQANTREILTLIETHQQELHQQRAGTGAVKSASALRNAAERIAVAGEQASDATPKQELGGFVGLV